MLVSKILIGVHELCIRARKPAKTDKLRHSGLSVLVSLQAMLFHQVAELPEAQAEHVGRPSLDPAGTLERALEMRALDVLQVPLEIEPVACLDDRLSGARGRRAAFAHVFRQGGQFDSVL